MNTSTFRRALAAAPLALLLAACDAGDPAAPRGIDGTYRLARVADRAVPALVFDGTYVDDEGVEHRVVLRADVGRIELREEGTRYVHKVDLSGWEDGVPILTADLNDEGACARSGATLICDSDLVQNRGFSATVAGGELTVLVDLSGEAPPLSNTYRR